MIDYFPVLDYEKSDCFCQLLYYFFCNTETVKTFFQKIIRKSSLKVIVRNTTKQLSLCFSEELDQPVPEEVNEICLHKQSIKKRLNNSKAKKFFGDDEGGDIISCSVNVRHRLISTQSASTNTVRASTQSAYQLNDSRNAINVSNCLWSKYTP